MWGLKSRPWNLGALNQQALLNCRDMIFVVLDKQYWAMIWQQLCHFPIVNLYIINTKIIALLQHLILNLFYFEITFVSAFYYRDEIAYNYWSSPFFL